MRHVLSIQTPLLGNRTYGELLRRAFADSKTIEFDAHWSDEAHERYGNGALERQLDRAFLKMMESPWIRTRNLDFFPLRYELGTSYWAHRTIRDLLETRRPDVIHLHTQAIAMLSPDTMRRIPTVVSADGTSVQMAAQQLEAPWRWTFGANHLLERRVFDDAEAVVAFSRWAANSMTADHGVDPAKIHVIPPGVDLTQFPNEDAQHDLPADAPLRILFVGGEFERKGGPQLVDAFLAEFAHDEHVQLHVVTKSASVPNHPRIIVHTGIEAYSDSWHRLYRDADLFVMPTKRDQSPNVFIEAMASGLPVIATPVGSAPDTVIDGSTGYIVGTGDMTALRARMRALANDPGLRRHLGAAGRARVETYFEAGANARALEELLVRISHSRVSRQV